MEHLTSTAPPGFGAAANRAISAAKQIIKLARATRGTRIFVTRGAWLFSVTIHGNGNASTHVATASDKRLGTKFFFRS